MSSPLASVPTSPTGTRPRILLVEDHVDTAQTVAQFLQGAGFDVTLADSVEAAVKHVVSEVFDILLCDIGLPDGTGVGLISAIRPFCRTPAIAITAYDRPEDREVCLRAGFNEHLGKPVEPAVLVSAVRAMLARA